MAKIDLRQNEEILLQKSGEYTNGSDRIKGQMNGKLILTNQRFLFVTSGMVIKAFRLDLDLPLSDIAEAKPKGICFGMDVISKNGDFSRFRITGRGAWLKKINELVK